MEKVSKKVAWRVSTVYNIYEISKLCTCSTSHFSCFNAGQGRKGSSPLGDNCLRELNIGNKVDEAVE